MTREEEPLPRVPARRLRVGYVTSFLPSFVWQEIETLAERGASVTHFTWTEQGDRFWSRILGERRAEGVRHIALPDRRRGLPAALRLVAGIAAQLVTAPLRSIRALGTGRLPLAHRLQFLWFARGIRRLEIRHLHAHFADVGAEVAELLSVATGVPFSFTVHAYDIFLHEDPATLRRLIRASKATVSISAFNREWLAARLGEDVRERIRVIRLGVRPGRARDAEAREAAAGGAPSGEPPRILAIPSALVEKKGTRYLLDALALLRSRRIPFRARILGGVSDERLDRLRGDVEDRLLDDDVECLGPVPRNEIPSMLAGAAVFALPSIVTASGDRDGIPVSLMEAMACGVPVVSTDVSGIPELIEDGVSGLLVREKDSLALACALERVLADPGLRERLGREGRKRVEERFHLDRNVASLEAFFLEPA